MLFKNLSTFVIVICLLSSSECFAQFGGNTGGGSTGGAGAGGGGRTTGGAQGGQAGIDTGQQLGITNLNEADGSLGAQVGQNAFVGQGSNGFIGNRFAGQANTGTAAQFGNLGQGASTRPENRVDSQRKQIRPQLRIAFEAPIVPPQQAQTNVAARLVKVPAFVKNSTEVDLTIDETGLLTMSGTVASEHDRRLLEAYIRMEPGVHSVLNRLSVSE